MTTKITVGEYIPDQLFKNLHISLKRCMAHKYIPNSTYFSNNVCIINDKANVSYVYNEQMNTINEVNKMERLPITITGGWGDTNLISKSIEAYDMSNMELSHDIHKSISYMLGMNAKHHNLIGIGNEPYIHQLLSQPRHQYLLAICDNTENIKDIKQNCSEHNLKFDCISISSYYDIIEYPPDSDYDINKGVDIVIDDPNIIVSCLGYLKYIKQHIGVICVVSPLKKNISELMNSDFVRYAYQLVSTQGMKYKVEIYVPKE